MCEPSGDHAFGHTPDNGAVAVLGKDGAASGVNEAASCGAVASHAGENAGEEAVLEDGGGRAEEDVGGGAAFVFGGVLVEGEGDGGAVGEQGHVEAAGGDPDLGVADVGAVAAFLGV